MSHELRTPLNAIIGFSSLIDDTLPFPKIMEMNKIIYNSGVHLLGIIESIFELTFLQSGQAKLNISKIQLKNIIYAVKNEGQKIQDIQHKKNILFQIHSENQNPGLHINNDQNKFQQIIFNLLNNAFK